MEPGGIVELRVPNAGFDGTISGYFADTEKLIQAAVAVNGKGPGVYVTINRIKTDLLARAANRTQTRAKNTTGDDDVLRRRWLLLDFDPKRPSGISSTESEHDAALQVAHSAKDTLDILGWPVPILADSGNGGHLLYSIDLPSKESTELLKGLLKAAAVKFGTPEVTVDVSVFNASRISKLYGTVAAKGDSTADRPHRLSRMLDIPETLEPVSFKLLEDFAGKPEPPPQRAPSHSTSFNLGDWISRHGVQVHRGPVPDNGSDKWVLKACPFNPDHTAPDAALFQNPSGALIFKCFHSSCADKKWQDFRAVYEPESVNRVSRQQRVNGSPAYSGTSSAVPAPVPEQPEPQTPKTQSALERAEELLNAAIDSKDPMMILGVGLTPSELIQALAQNEISKTQRVEAKSRIKKNFKAIDVSLREFDTRLADEIQKNRGLFAVEFQPAVSGLPQIMTTSRQLRDITSEALATVNPPDAPVIFIRSGDLVHVVRDEGGRPSVSPASETWIRSVLARSADWMKYNQFGEVKPTFPPMDVVRDMSVLSDLPFPALTSVTEVPTLSPAGTIISEPGYDQDSGVYYAPSPNLKHFPLPADPTREQVSAAIENINDAIGEFPYEDEASRANVFGLLLTPVLRPSIIGCTPLAVVDAPQAGTGKSLLIDVLSIITTGRPSAMVPYPYKEEEMQKQIGASLAAGRQLIAFDNLEGELRSPCLALALTAKEYEARILGFSRNMTVPNVSTWIVTGNNIRPAGDMPRRCYQIRLNAKQAVPYRGREFKHPDLLKWVFSNRSELLHSLLVISRFWFSRGCPEGTSGPAIGSFEDWHRKVSGILRAAQVKGFLANYTAFIEQEDESPRQWEGFLEQLHETLPGGEDKSCSGWFAVSDLLPMIGGTMSSPLRDCIPAEIADCLDRKVNHLIVIGKMFRSRRERRFGPYCLERNTEDGKHKGAASWRVRKHAPGQPDTDSL